MIDEEANKRVVEKVEEVYQWLDRQIREQAQGRECEACGDCCDFEAFEHRLFVTPPELAYLAAKPGGEELRSMPTGRCPYNIDGKCTIYEHRFAGCRIFACKGDEDFQSRLSEWALEKFKSICTDFDIPYRYADLASALNSC
ncbi:MAG: YkgJ family cysteine cluster protein [Planctomycetota bacterium]|jgi:Fe-S-cluster containining protein